MTNVRIQVDSIALGEVTVTVEDSFVIHGDDDHARRKVAQLLDDAVAKIRRAYGITEDRSTSTELAEAQETIQRVHRLLQADEMGLKTYGITRDDLRAALAGGQ